MRSYCPLFLFARIFALICAAALCVSLVSCVPKNDASENKPTEQTGDGFTGKIYFEGRRYTFEGDGDCISAEDDALVIKKEGVYLVTGRLAEGRIVTDAPCVRLVLDGAELCSSVSSVIEARRGALTIESEENSLNIIRGEYNSGGGRRGAIHTEGDLFLAGRGKTVVTARGLSYALVCGRLYGESGELSLTAENGIYAREAEISGGRLSINGSKIGIYGENRIKMIGGSLVALCDDVALYAENEIILTGGERDIRAPKPYFCKKEENSKKIKGQ